MPIGGCAPCDGCDGDEDNNDAWLSLSLARSTWRLWLGDCAVMVAIVIGMVLAVVAWWLCPCHWHGPGGCAPVVVCPVAVVAVPPCPRGQHVV